MCEEIDRGINVDKWLKLDNIGVLKSKPRDDNEKIGDSVILRKDENIFKEKEIIINGRKYFFDCKLK